MSTGGNNPYGQMPGDRSGISDLNKDAPVPHGPSLYPDNAKYYRVPITFEIELIDPSASPSGATASANGSGGAS
jgi:hypothetical protein